VVLEQKQQEQEQQRANNIQSVNNGGGHRGDVEIDSPFLEFYEAEQDAGRKLGELEPLTADDFVIDENPVYAIARLKEFFKDTKIPIEEESEIVDEAPLALRAIEVHDSKDTVSAKW